MVKKINLLVGIFATLSLCMPETKAQVTVNPTDDNFVIKPHKTRHSEWRDGKSQFPGRPRDMWQVGIGAGSFIVSGDVKPAFGWGASVHVRKSIGYVFSLRAEYMFGQASGLNYAASNVRAFPNLAPFTTTTVDGLVQTPGLYGEKDNFHANYKIPQHHAFSIQTVYNINNIKFHKRSNKWSLNLILGLGANMYQTKIDALDENGNSYATQMGAIVTKTKAGTYDLTDLGDRSTILNELRGILDKNYETLAQQNANNLLTLGKDEDRMVVNPFLNVGISFEYLITKRISIALEHQAFISDDDFFDGKSRKENGSRTSNIDIPHYTSLRLGIHIGKKEKAIQPLWFINPLIFPMQDVADLKEKLDDDWFKDTDKDGVPDALDEEKDTPPGTEVDSKGRALDSDGDGIPNSEDKEPYSPVGYPIDEAGIAQVPKPLHAQDVKVIPGDPETGKQPTLVIGDEIYDPLGGQEVGGGGTLKDWYLPMIHFDLDKYYLRAESYEQLLHVASVMKAYKKLKIVVHGHTDIRSSNEYNNMLSYNRAMTAIDYLVNKYGVDRSRFILKYNGEVANLVDNAANEPEHFMNRRVEFYIAEDGVQEQPKPTNDGGKNRKWKY